MSDPTRPPPVSRDPLTASLTDPAATTGGGHPTAAPAGPPASAGRYVLGAEIARGGMGEVYRATDAVLGREVAVKVLQAKYPPDSGTARRFLDEARITGQLQHPGIPPVHDLGTLPDGRPFLAMKLVKGDTLDALLRHRPDQSADRGRFVAVFEGVCQAVAYAHAHGVLHRDLKPGNVMVGAFGEVQVMDWGLAKVLANRGCEPAGGSPDPDATAPGTVVQSLRDSNELLTQAGSMLGTPAFMPPEQAIGAVDRIDRRTDVFGLGAILCILLTGQPPYVGDTAESTRQLAARAKLDDAYARLDGCGAEPDLIALCRQCLSAELEHRPADAGAVAAAVHTLRTAADERARRAEIDRERAEVAAAEQRKRRRLVQWAGGVTAAVVVGGLAAVLIVQHRATQAVEAKNRQLADEQARTEARFELAQKAIATFHTGVSEDALLKNDQFRELRTKLLRQAADFYADLEKLLTGQTDLQSRRALGAAYLDLGKLIDKIGDTRQSLEVLQKSVTVRREVAAESAAAGDRLALARSLVRLNVNHQRSGNTVACLEACDEMRRVCEGVLADAPSAEAKSLLAQAHFERAAVLSPLERMAEALTEVDRSRALLEELTREQPGEREFQNDLATTYSLLGYVLCAVGKGTEGIDTARRGVAIRERLAGASPEDADLQAELANDYLDLATGLGRSGKPAATVEWIHKARAVLERLVTRRPAVLKHLADLADCHRLLSSTQLETGNLADALDSCESARSIYQRLVDANPTSAVYRYWFGQTYQGIGLVRGAMGQFADALAAHQRAKTIWTELAKADPLNGLLAIRLANQDDNIGWELTQLRRLPEALAVLDQAVSASQALPDSDPSNTEYASVLAYSRAYRGRARVRAGEPADGAAEDLRAGIEGWLKTTPNPNGEAFFLRGQLYALLAGLAADPASGVTAEEGRAFADKVVPHLRRAIEAGWNWDHRYWLAEPDFDAVRNRDDFQKLFAEVEAKARRPEVLPPPRRG